ncbi:hypothetical protein Taro_036692 [Colocasia esculenta]|uniref:Uncharacterized protein n=1 Tax=Colocasia esculenta TaxID=4460 RepID=A0A843WAJ0_COLES|nr:hypothetical protein [Colocasia esculenta]
MNRNLLFHLCMCTADFKNLQSLEVCGGSVTDAGVKNIIELTSLTHLNLSQNSSLTDKTLELISGLTGLVSLNLSSTHITNAGLQNLKPLKNLRSLHLDCCRVTGSEMKKLHLAALQNLQRILSTPLRHVSLDTAKAFALGMTLGNTE